MNIEMFIGTDPTMRHNLTAIILWFLLFNGWILNKYTFIIEPSVIP
jgi:hypothetical protein